MRAVQLTLAAAALGLCACQAQGGAGKGSASVCAPFTQAAAAPAQTAVATPAVAAPLPAADPAAGVEDCLHRWAYALATSTDDAGHVAQAVTAACEPTLGRWNQQTASQSDGGPVEAPSLITGRPTSPIEQHLSFAQ